MNEIYGRLLASCADARIVNTHSHHLPDGQQGQSLSWMLDNAYVSWRGIDHRADRAGFLRRLAGSSYLYWLQRALADLCGMREPLDEGNWAEYENRVSALCADPEAHLRILRENCGYDRVILDAYWKPGDDDGHPALFAPSYRINMYLFGYAPEARDHNGSNPFAVNGWSRPDSLKAYVDAMLGEVERRKAAGCVALKCAAAYDRGLDFAPPSPKDAEAALNNPDATAGEIKAFQDYIFHVLCDAAGEIGLPMQIHTGLGLGHRSNALWLREAIQSHPKTVFSLMHGSYPWTEDLLFLTHNCPNVVADICWLPILSTTACERFIQEWVDVGDMDRITWGCDTWQSFESYGAVLAARETLARAFAGLVERGRLTPCQAEAYIRHILGENAAALYRL